MNAAKRAASQTITVAAIQVTAPSIVRPSDSGSAAMSAMRAWRAPRLPRKPAPSASHLHEQERVEQCEDDREDCDRHEEGRAVQVHAVEERCGDDQADRVRGGRHRDAHEQADHAGTLLDGPDG